MFENKNDETDETDELDAGKNVEPALNQISDNANQATGKDNNQSIEHFLGCGAYQVWHIFLSLLITIAHASNMTLMAFGKAVPDVLCHNSAYGTNYSKPLKPTVYCELWKRNECKNFTLIAEFKSVPYEWNLLCEDTKVVIHSLTLQMIGVLIGCQVWGLMADWYGRKWVLFAALFGLITTGASSVLCPNITAFSICRFFIGIFIAGTLGTNHVYMNEFMISKHRLWIGCITSWAIPQMLMALLAWWAGDWKNMTLACNLVAIPALFMLCFMKESPWWLVQKGKHEAAQRSLDHVTKLNSFSCVGSAANQAIKCNIDLAFLKKPKSKKKYSFWHLYSRRTMSVHTNVLCFIFCSMSIISYGIIFDMDSFAGSIFWNFFLFAFLKFIASLLTIFADTFCKSAGRKSIFWLPKALLSICCFAIFMLKQFGMAKTTLETVISMIAIMATSPVWTSIVLSLTELYPTPVRNVAMGFIGVASRLGGAIAPQILLLAKIWAPLTYLIYTILCVTSLTLYVVYIPETKGCVLPQHMPSKDNNKSNENTLKLINNDIKTGVSKQ